MSEEKKKNQTFLYLNKDLKFIISAQLSPEGITTCYFAK